MNFLKTLQNAPGRIQPSTDSAPPSATRFAMALQCGIRASASSRNPVFHRLANHGAATPWEIVDKVPHGALLANALPFRILQDNWIQVPYGDFPHVGPMDRSGRPLFPKGVIQRVDQASAQAMVNEFNSLVSRIGRAVFGGLPWYIGHHDVDPVTYPDPKSYGWVMDMKAANDGFYLQVNWTPDGDALKTNGSFKYYSPYWDAKKTDAIENGMPVLTPTRLLSVGFTNNPNMPVLPLANEAAPPQLTDTEVEKLPELANAGTSEGARKGWETRRGNAAASAKAGASRPHAKAAAKSMKAKKRALMKPNADGSARSAWSRWSRAAAATQKKTAASIKATPMTRDEANGHLSDLAHEFKKGHDSQLDSKLEALKPEGRKGIVQALKLKTDKSLPFKAASPLMEKHGAAVARAAKKLHDHALL